MSTKTETELIDSAGGRGASPSGTQRPGGVTRPPQGALRSGCRGGFVIVLPTR
jgi:hypothetical protein